MRRDKFRSLGLCIKCGKTRPSGEHVKCDVCLELQKSLYHSRKDSGLCLDCGVDCKNRFCEKCYVKRVSVKRCGSIELWEKLLNLFYFQKQICPYSGVFLELGKNVDLDHKIPISKGGSNELSNLQWVYSPINTMKWDLDEIEFLQLVKRVAIHSALHP